MKDFNAEEIEERKKRISPELKFKMLFQQIGEQSKIGGVHSPKARIEDNAQAGQYWEKWRWEEFVQGVIVQSKSEGYGLTKEQQQQVRAELERVSKLKVEARELFDETPPTKSRSRTE